MRILWADDNPKVIKHPVATLEANVPDCSVARASSIAATFRNLRKSEFDVVILDVYGIPHGGLTDEELATLSPSLQEYRDATGLALLKAIRDGATGPLNSKAPVILVSGFMSRVIVEAAGLPPEKVFYVQKQDIYDPPPNKLLETVRTATEQIESNEAEVTATEAEQTAPASVDSLRDLHLSFARLVHDHMAEYLAALEAIENSLGFFAVWHKQTKHIDISKALKRLDELLRRAKNLLAKRDEAAAESLLTKIDTAIEAGKTLEGYTSELLPTNVWEVIRLAREICSWATVRPLLGDEITNEIIALARDLDARLSSDDLSQTAIRLDNMMSQAQLLSGYLGATDGSKERVFEDVWLSLIVQDAMEACGGFSTTEGVDLQLFDPGTDFKVSGVADELVRALSNIIVNGIKYTDKRPLPGGKLPWVEVRMTGKGKEATISVESWGPGISKTEMDQRLIFNEGYRGPGAARMALGHGMGLADAQRVIERHGGTIEVTSRSRSRNGGSASPQVNTFTVSLPCIRVRR